MAPSAAARPAAMPSSPEMFPGCLSPVALTCDAAAAAHPTSCDKPNVVALHGPVPSDPRQVSTQTAHPNPSNARQHERCLRQIESVNSKEAGCEPHRTGQTRQTRCARALARAPRPGGATCGPLATRGATRGAGSGCTGRCARAIARWASRGPALPPRNGSKGRWRRGLVRPAPRRALGARRAVSAGGSIAQAKPTLAGARQGTETRATVTRRKPAARMAPAAVARIMAPAAAAQKGSRGRSGADPAPPYGPPRQPPPHRAPRRRRGSRPTARGAAGAIQRRHPRRRPRPTGGRLRAAAAAPAAPRAWASPRQARGRARGRRAARSPRGGAARGGGGRPRRGAWRRSHGPRRPQRRPCTWRASAPAALRIRLVRVRDAACPISTRGGGARRRNRRRRCKAARGTCAGRRPPSAPRGLAAAGGRWRQNVRKMQLYRRRRRLQSGPLLLPADLSPVGGFACLSVWFGRMIPGLYEVIQYTHSLFPPLGRGVSD